MGIITTHRPHATQPATVGLRMAIVALTLATAQIHASLGGMLFTLNAIAYTGFAAAMLLPGVFIEIRWLTRYALLGFTATTILAWLAFGARFDLAYLDKAMEVALIALLFVESWVVDGGPITAARRARSIVGDLLR